MRYGQVTQQPQDAIAGREEVTARFAGAHPNNNMHHDGSYFVIERRVGNTWKYYTADNNPDTFFEWKRIGVSASQVTVRWNVPAIPLRASTASYYAMPRRTRRLLPRLRVRLESSKWHSPAASADL